MGWPRPHLHRRESIHTPCPRGQSTTDTCIPLVSLTPHPLPMQEETCLNSEFEGRTWQDQLSLIHPAAP